MYLRITVPAEGHDSNDYPGAVFFLHHTIDWDDVVSVYRPIDDLALFDPAMSETRVTLTFNKGRATESTITDPDWVDWGVVAELPAP